MKKNKKKFLSSIFLLLLLTLYLFTSDYFIDEEKEDKSYQERKVEDVDTVSNLSKLNVYFMDVGQADSILISYDNKNMLIDAGNNEDGMKLVKYFKDKGISSFEYVVATHAHEDHIGGMDDIIDNFDISTFFMPKQITTTKTFEDMVDALDRNEVSFVNPSIGYTFNLDDISFEIIYVSDSETSDLNDTSIVLKLVYLNNSFLFMGDASNNVEKQIIDKDLKSDVLKVGHHGSNTSSSAKFIKKVHPKYAVFSVGSFNNYNHPREITLKKLEYIGSKIYRTDLDGTIHMESDGKEINVETLKTDTNG